MAQPYSVTIEKITQELSLEAVYMPEGGEQRTIVSAEVDRPGLGLAGCFEYFDNMRVQVIGKGEYGYLEKLTPEQRKNSVRELASHRPPMMVVARELEVIPELVDACREWEVPLLSTADTTSTFMAALIAFLNVQLAPRITRHGVLVEVSGEGVLLVGDSGIGKSETAIELVKRGHRLIADDAVEIRRVSSKSLVGSAPENIRHYIELRGIGIVNVRRIFGMGAVKMTEKIDMVIQMEPWDNNKTYDRMGLDNEYMDILGITVPMLTIPVKPGRNLAMIIEVAAMNNRQKKMGYNAAHELMQNLGMSDDGLPVEPHKEPQVF